MEKNNQNPELSNSKNTSKLELEEDKKGDPNDTSGIFKEPPKFIRLKNY